MPTERQKKLAKAIVKNAVAKFPKTMGQVVESSGYSHNTATKQLPAVVEQKGVLEELKNLGYVDKFKLLIPDEDLIRVHLEGLKAVKIHSSMTEPDRIEDDFAVRHKYLDLAYKLRGDLAPEKHINIDIGLKANLDSKKIDEINEIALDETIE